MFACEQNTWVLFVLKEEIERTRGGDEWEKEGEREQEEGGGREVRRKSRGWGRRGWRRKRRKRKRKR